jgi:hypothetical protein
MNMEIKFHMCTNEDTGLFEDIVNFPEIQEYLDAYISNETAFRALDFMIGITDMPGDYSSGKRYMIVSCGQLQEDAIKEVKKALKSLPENRRLLPNDTTQIIANGFEGELRIIL